MKSSMAITRGAAFRFMLLLHLFLKVKMCVGGGFVDAAAVAAGDSDINYDDSDEWLGGADHDQGDGRLPVWAALRPSSTNVPAPANLIRWDGGHVARSRMHHVRHEQHYLKQRPLKSSSMVAPEPGIYQAHTVTTDTVNGPDHHQKSRHSHHSHHHHSQHHAHSHHHRSSSSGSSGEEVTLVNTRQGSALRSVTPSPNRRSWQDEQDFRLSANGLSGRRDAQDRQAAVMNRKRSASTFHTVGSNALPETGPSSRGSSSGRAPKSSHKSVNPQSKYYFEELLNNYKSSSPYYKELHEAKGPQMKALAMGNRNQRSSPKSKATPSADGDLDYLYDDETDDSVQNDAPHGGTTSTSPRPASTSSSTTTTTTTTTVRSIASSSADSDESGDDGTSEGDPSYSTYYQKAYAMHSQPRRNGNNRYNSIARPPPVTTTLGQQHKQQRVDPAKQVTYPGQYESLTDYKQANFGSKDAVDRSYKAYNSANHARQEVLSHINRINSEGECKIPKPKLVPASLDRTKVYTPHCTILHRCEDDTGCCLPMETCAPKSTRDVQLYFYVGNLRSRHQRTITTLTFTNHTECHCVRLDPELHQRSSSRPQPQSSLEQNSEGSGGSSDGPPVSGCKCPRHFKSVMDNAGQCYCDCLSNDRDCIRFKEGYENFSMETRKCIRSKMCNVPHCEYGMYHRNEGRCPRKIDRINEHFPQYR